MDDTARDDTVLPMPFNATSWAKPLRPAAQALWDWHLSLATPLVPVKGEGQIIKFFEEEVAQAEAGGPMRVVPSTVAEAAYAACNTHSLPRTLLAAQVGAAIRYVSPIRFATVADLTTFIQQRAGSHGRLLGRLAGHTGSWQLPRVDELTRAYFLIGSLATLPTDLARDRLYLPLDEMHHAGVAEEQLRRGVIDENMNRLFWKQTVRIRDGFANGQSLVKDLTGWQRRVFKKWWLGGLYLLSEFEKRKYDVWSRPLVLSPLHHFQVKLQALVGKTSFR